MTFLISLEKQFSRINRKLLKAPYILHWRPSHRKKNINDKPCIICANHSNYIDPFLIAVAFGKDNPIHFMAKIELFRNKTIADLLAQVGAFGVDRDGTDIGAIRTVMKYIRTGEKVGIFPEGTRVKVDGAVEAKAGAARMAAKLKR